MKTTFATIKKASVVSLLSIAVMTAIAAPSSAKSFKDGSRWSSGDYFGPRSGAVMPAAEVAENFRKRNGYVSGDYFGPKG